ncbi:hypothetical protein BpHYR1_050662 [Brachionus plicatilis]|uniref:Uncharacterized protein n=1 Tax=Brachionus plicatilis TaxID=10195 RepID=A0A3M7P875_BRAPC|nr:hypothetical protein BpHYR1_050662 [Brachionus plicatilis]
MKQDSHILQALIFGKAGVKRNLFVEVTRNFSSEKMTDDSKLSIGTGFESDVGSDSKEASLTKGLYEPHTLTNISPQSFDKFNTDTDTIKQAIENSFTKK